VPHERSCYVARMSEKGSETRALILHEALQLASVVGFNALTIGALAERTRMSKSGLFAHFKSKAELQLQTLDHGRRQFETAVISPAFDAPSGRSRLLELFERWRGWDEDALEGGCIFVGSAAELDDQPGPMREALVRELRRWRDILIRESRRAIGNGEAPEGAVPEDLAFRMQSIMLGFQYEARLLQVSGAAERATRAFHAIFAA
jgi:AcrR family transcriptional regulator